MGVFRTLGFFRGRLQSGEPLDVDERAGLVDLLNLTEEYIAQTWPVSRDGQSRRMTSVKHLAHRMAGGLEVIAAWFLSCA